MSDQNKPTPLPIKSAVPTCKDGSCTKLIANEIKKSDPEDKDAAMQQLLGK